jgi:purine-binding chemotaxis protein CheW
MTTDTAVTVEEQQLVVFDLGTESYGVDIETVREIIRMQEITKMPGTPAYVQGVINLRGKVTPVVDLRARFGLPVTEFTKDSRIVVVDINKQSIGAIVDAVTEVLRISTEAVEPPSSVVTSEDSGYITGIVKLPERLIILLDLARALSDDEVTGLAA